jgi:hypothetical protein
MAVFLFGGAMAGMETDDTLSKLIADIESAPARFRERVERELVPKVKDRTLAIIRKYPPARRGSRYRRTYKLRNSWQVLADIQLYSGEMTATNDTSYSPYVQDSDYQSWFHAETGWITIQETVEDVAHDAERELIDIWDEVTR